MKIATWNIGKDLSKKDGKIDLNSYEYIIKSINNENIDVICLQEAIVKSDYLPAISNYIKENTDLKYIVSYELSSSVSNQDCNMGIVICSKYKIDHYELLKLDNPGFTKQISEHDTRYSLDKGFIISSINGFNIITGHTLAFFFFNKDIKNYLDIFKKAEDKFLEVYHNNSALILCGDFNYEYANTLFPKLLDNCTDLISTNTYKDKKIDHFIISNSLKCNGINVIDTLFDHKLCVCEIVKEEIPKSILEYGFDFDWDEKDVWALDYPKEEISIEKLKWHFDVPFWDYNGDHYNLKPTDVINDKEKYKEQYDRIISSDISYPIDVMENKGRLVILDGLHRLVKCKMLGMDKVSVRIIPREEIKTIARGV